MHVLPLDPLDRVTGSCTVVHLPGPDLRLLVDCGLYQDGPDVDIANDRPFPFDASKIHAVLLTHGHLDHCGRLPALVRAGFSGTVLATEETIAIAKTVLEDAARITGRAADRDAVRRIRWRSFGTNLFVAPLPIATDVFVAAYRSAHILGAASLEILHGDPKRRDEQVRCLFSGDVGNNLDGAEVQPFLRHVMHPSSTVHLAVLESTYGAIRRDADCFEAAARRAALAAAVGEILARGGTAVIPAFAVQRAQDVLWDLHVLLAEDPGRFGGAPVLLDAPMAQGLHPLWVAAMNRDMVSPHGKVRPLWLGRHVFRELGLDPESPDDLRRVRAAIGRVFGHDGRAPRVGEADTVHERLVARWRSVDGRDRDRLVEAGGPRIVVATGGMADAGPVQAWLRGSLLDPRAGVVFTGYCAHGTLGGALLALGALTEAERARMDARLPLPGLEPRGSDVRASLHVVRGYSGHADQGRLVAWTFPVGKDGRPFLAARRLVLNHGTPTARRELRDALLARAAAEGLPLEVSLPDERSAGVDARTGAPVPRESILGVRTEATIARAEVERLRAEVAALKAELGRV